MSDGWSRRQERTRQAVFEAVGAIIAEGGLEALTMRKLAERADVAVATLYNQFGDRRQLLVAFVDHGLDQLELEFDAAPAAGPVDTTRQLFAALDDEFAARPEVWRPIFSMLKSGADVHGMSAVGDRVVALIEADLDKAAAADLFVADVDTARLARHVLTTRMSRLEKWALGVIEWDAYVESSRVGLELVLGSVLVEPLRTSSLRRSGLVR